MEAYLAETGCTGAPESRKRVPAIASLMCHKKVSTISSTFHKCRASAHLCAQRVQASYLACSNTPSINEGIRFRSNSHTRVSKHNYHLLTPSVYPHHTAQTGEHQSINVGSIQQTHAPFLFATSSTPHFFSHTRAQVPMNAPARRVSSEIRQ